jgi:ribulose bisphosphate carboxylase small subunit
MALETCNKEYRPEYLKIFLYNPNIKNIGKAIIMEIIKVSNPLSERGIRSPSLK